MRWDPAAEEYEQETLRERYERRRLREAHRSLDEFRGPKGAERRERRER